MTEVSPSGVKAKWDRIHAEAASQSPEPARVLAENAHMLPTSGTALDLACGLGGNARFLAGRGLAVAAWDISEVALASLGAWSRENGRSVGCRCIDLENEDFPAEEFDVVVVSRFLNRSIAPSIAAAVKPGGLLFYQTYTLDKLSSAGPSNPEFLLRQGELLRLFSALIPRYYRDDGRAGDLDLGLRNEACFVGQKPL